MDVFNVEAGFDVKGAQPIVFVKCLSNRAILLLNDEVNILDKPFRMSVKLADPTGPLKLAGVSNLSCRCKT